MQPMNDQYFAQKSDDPGRQNFFGVRWPVGQNDSKPRSAQPFDNCCIPYHTLDSTLWRVHSRNYCRGNFPPAPDIGVPNFVVALVLDNQPAVQVPVDDTVVDYYYYYY